MRPRRLVIEGFGPFRDRQTVDFDAVARDGIFLITGPTGAGKTTILDALCFALFNTVPGPRGSAADLRSHLTAPGDPTRVELEFSVAGRRFRIERSPQYRRPRKRGAGMTTQNHTVALAELVDGEWSGISRTAQETQAFLDQIIGLTAAQFTKLVVLPQGDFAAFLHADPAEREAILEKLFATQHFRAVERVLGERATRARRATEEGEQRRRFALESAAAAAWEELPDPPPHPTIPDTLAQLGLAAVSAQERSAVADAVVQLEQERAAAAQDTAEGWAGRRDDRAALAALRADEQRWEEDAPARADLESRLRRARAARGLLRPRDALARAQDDAAQRDRVLENARATVRSALPHRATVTVEELTDAQLAELSAHLERTAERLARLTLLDARASRAQTAAETAERTAETARAAVTETEEELASVRTRIEEHRAESDALEPVAAAQDGLRENRRLLAAARTATAQHEAADSHVLDASEAAESTARRLAELRAAARADAAAQLAATLVESDPCPVCGSPHHPHPARPAADGPSPETLDDAEAADRRARDDLAAARAALTAAAEALETARTAVADLDAGAVERELAEARAAADRRTSLQQAIRTGGDRVRVLEEALRRAREESARLQEERTRAGTAATEARSALDEARTGHADETPPALALLGLDPPHDETDAREAATVSAHLRTAHGTWVRAREEATTAHRDVRARRDDLTAALAESEFADLEALDAAARLPLESLEEQREEQRAQAARLALRRAADSVVRALADPATAEELAHATDAAHDAAVRTRAEADAASQQAVLAHARRDAAQQALSTARAEQRADQDRLDELGRDIDVAELVLGTSADAASRMSLSSFALAALFEDVAVHATDRLVDMTAGRFRFRHDLERRRGDQRAGLGLKIVDTFTDEARDPRTLSGGEGFMASLALALGMADTVRGETGGIDLDALFLDEGFGTLDADTLGDVLAVLDRLRTGGRTVGIISHVAELQQAIPTRIVVEPGPRGATIGTAGPDAVPGPDRLR